MSSTVLRAGYQNGLRIYLPHIDVMTKGLSKRRGWPVVASVMELVRTRLTLSSGGYGAGYPSYPVPGNA
jgi:hypothetical protein